MYPTVFSVLSLAFAAFAPGCRAALTFEQSCSALAQNLHINNVKVQFTQYLTKGTNLSIPDYPLSCINGTGTSNHQVIYADLCRVALLITTSKTSNVTAEVWLPSNWNHRVLEGGVGGLTGCIQYTDLVYYSASGFAAISHNNGHNGSTGEAFYHSPGVIQDYAHRATYTGAVVGKQVTQFFYQEAPSKSYYMGCSGGGRQGFYFAQSHPEVFDGIIAAAPAINFNNLINWGSWLSILGGFDVNSRDFISLGLWSVIHEEVLRQCDGLDGSVDGTIEDPDLCNPIFETLICQNSTSDPLTCLNGAQAAKARQIFQPLYGLDGTLLFPRLQPGAELLAAISYISGLPSALGNDWFRYVVYNNPLLDTRTLTLKDFAFANLLDPYGVSTWNADLSAFQKRGGRLIQIHGMEDGIITGEISKLYYHRVAEALSQSPSELDEFYRYFRVSGMGHCTLGSGAYNIGMYAWGNNPDATPTDPDDNIISRLIAWVEQGQAPDFIRGTSFVNQTLGLGIDYKRKHCKYPKRNVHVGPGSYKDENSWQCVD